jgi:excisionase family DNA binding protein
VANTELMTTSELAGLLGVTRQAVFKWIKAGEIDAVKVGNTYGIPRSSVPSLSDRTSPAKKKGIEAAVDKTIEEYGEVLRRLARE